MVCGTSCRTTLWKEGFSSQRLLFWVPESATKSTRNQELRLQGRHKPGVCHHKSSDSLSGALRGHQEEMLIWPFRQGSVDRLFILTENTVLSIRTDLSIIGMDSGTFKTRTAELTGVRSHSSEAQARGWQLYSLAGLELASPQVRNHFFTFSDKISFFFNSKDPDFFPS